MIRLARLEALRLVRSRALMVALAIWCVAAAAAVTHGQAVIARQREALASADRLQAEQHDAVLRHQPSSAPAGDQLYYLTFHTRHAPSAWAPISIGQRDQRAFNLKVRMLALQGQLYDADLTSPLLASFGAFDLAFVIVALAPLLVIAVAHDLVSAEREAGTWRLVRAQPVHALRVLALKAAVRVGAIAVVVLATVVAAPLAVGAPLDGRVGMVAVCALAYLGVWTGAVVFVATLGRGSEVNALALIGLWLAWVVVGPALVTTAASARFPAPEALELTVQQRQGYHSAWDRPVAETMRQFHARYPEWRDVPVPTDRYSNAWYYAMQQRGDDAAAAAADAYASALRARHAWAQRWWPLLPPALVQAGFDRLARTDLPAYQAYLASVAAFHERLKRRFFPVVFREAAIRDVDWQDLPRHAHADEGRPADLRPALSGLGLWLAVTASAVWSRRRHL